MYRRLKKENIEQPLMTTAQVQEEAKHYTVNRKIYDELRKAYLDDRITQEQLKQLRDMVKAGDADGAVKGLAVMMKYPWDGDVRGNV